MLYLQASFKSKIIWKQKVKEKNDVINLHLLAHKAILYMFRGKKYNLYVWTEAKSFQVGIKSGYL